jgi:uncharacterized protein YdcH (DUF465 family)
MNAEDAQEVKHLLPQSHEQYRQLADQQSQLDHRLRQLRDKLHLSASEHVEGVSLKKHKLALKDRMEEIGLEHSQSRAS